jgi:hypothetical protein
MATAKKTTKKVEEVEVIHIAEIITEEQLEILEVSTKETIVSLKEELPLKQLAVLNPMLVELMKVKAFEEIKYNPEKEKESALEYEEANKQITAFIKLAGEAKSAIKKPLDAIGKNVLKVEKDVIAIASEVRNTIQTEFVIYLTEKARVAKEKADKIIAKEAAAIKLLEDSQREMKDMALKSEIANKIKYEVLEKTSDIVDNAIDAYSLEALNTLSQEIEGYSDFQGMLNARNISFISGETELFNQEEQDMLSSFYLRKVASLKKVVDTKIQLKSLEKVVEIDQITSTAKSNFKESFQSNLGLNFGSENGIFPEPKQEIALIVKNPELDIETLLSTNYSDLSLVLDFSKTKLAEERINLTSIYNEARKIPNPDTKSLAKISGVIIMFGKIIDYIDGKSIPAIKS